MPKTSVEAEFDFLVSKVIWPHFKARSYRKAGNNFRCLHVDESGKILSFQKSRFYDKQHIHFTLNAGMYLPEVDEFRTSNTFTEPDCFIRKRIGFLKPERHDLWYDILPTTNTAELHKAVEDDVVSYILPFLNQAQSRSDMLQLIIDQPQLVHAPTAIRVFHANGYLAEAQARLQQELAAGTQWDRRWYKDLAAELGLQEN
ncbi:DUF4304 domain-containing protein [Hymenobacter latericus]|uniref:DUF4304 domain-containing protein n=1 Tax=Hymenobacter sp. YIM 151858-1 TaxID=2987688 RepID=UPI00222705CD|nr:DUF4304 domain-containing protein [Hymenobacter sp. YIM 151858-1]UYZ57634.1 DUF4304 domain-containing protein [Hymenobacter sp. YIM 151858-1]